MDKIPVLDCVWQGKWSQPDASDVELHTNMACMTTNTFLKLFEMAGHPSAQREGIMWKRRYRLENRQIYERAPGTYAGYANFYDVEWYLCWYYKEGNHIFTGHRPIKIVEEVFHPEYSISLLTQALRQKQLYKAMGVPHSFAELIRHKGLKP